MASGDFSLLFSFSSLSIRVVKAEHLRRVKIGEVNLGQEQRLMSTV